MKHGPMAGGPMHGQIHIDKFHLLNVAYSPGLRVSDDWRATVPGPHITYGTYVFHDAIRMWIWHGPAECVPRGWPSQLEA